MAKRQARFTTQDLEGLPELDDDSPELWAEGKSPVARGLLTSAVRCFASNGYHATTTRDISSGMGLSPAAMYVHFPSKEVVLFEIIRAAHVAVLEEIRRPPDEPDGDAADGLRELVFRYTAWHATHHVAARVSQFELAGLSAEHYEEILRIRHETNDVFRQVIAAGVDDGSFGEVDVKRVTRALLSLSIDLVRWYRRDGSDSPEMLGRFNADLALRIVGADTPRD
jgi:AcrR family transcriptional regulator